MVNVIIIGAGLSGLAMSVGLAKQGFTVDLVEKRPTFLPMGATLGIAPNGLKALEELCPGIVDELNTKGVTTSRGPLLPWYYIRDNLLERARRCETIRIHTGLNVNSIEDEGNSGGSGGGTSEVAVVRFADSELVLKGHMVIGADGVHSKVREILGLAPAMWTGRVLWRGCVNALKEDSQLGPLLEKGICPLGHVVMKGAYFLSFNYHPKIPGRMTYLLSIDTNNSDEQINTDLDDPYKILKTGLVGDDERAQYIKSLLDESETIVQKVKLYVQDISLSRLPKRGGWGGRRRVTLIGDAAHAMNPIDALGSSMAFEDCVLLCRKLTENVSSGAGGGKCSPLLDPCSCHELILEFENERLPRVRRIYEDQEMRTSRRMKGEKVEPWSAEFEEWVFSGI